VRGARSDVDVLDIQRFGVPMEPGLELGSIVSLQNEDAERKSISNLVQELDCRALIAGIVDLQDSDTRAVVDGGELIEPLTGPRDALKELHVHLQAVPGLGLLVPFPTLAVRLMLLVGRLPAHAVLDQDPMHGRASDLHLVKALHVGGDPVRPKVIVLPQIQNLADYRRRCGARRAVRRSRLISQSGFPEPIKAFLPAVESSS